MAENSISAAQLKRLQTLWGIHWKTVALDGFSHNADGAASRLGRLGWIAGVIGRQLESAKDLTRAEVIRVLDALAKLVPAHLVKKNQRRRGGREISHARGTAGRKGQPGGKEIIMPGAEDYAKLDAALRSLEWNQERLAAFLRARTGPLRGRTTIYTLADLNRVLWALEGIERRKKKSASVESAKSVDALEEVAAT